MATRSNGFILITTLIVLAVLATFALGLSQQIRLHLAMEQFQKDAAAANRLLADGVTYATSELRSGEEKNHPYRFENVDTALLGISGGSRLEVWTMELGGLFNINETPREIVGEVVSQLISSPVDAKAITEAIMDWRDTDTIGSSEGVNTLNQQMRYRPRNGPLLRIEELSFVAGVDQIIYKGEDANHNLVLDPSENDGIEGLPLDNQDGILQLGLRDYFSVREAPEININSAPAHVWETIFRWALGDDRYRAPLLAQRIESYRAGGDGVLGTVDDQRFTDPEGWKQAIGTRETEVIATVEQMFSFCVEPTGYVVNVRATLESERIVRNGRAWFILDDDEKPKLCRYEVST